jgi:hypothetical protein
MKIIFGPQNALPIAGLSLLGTCLVASPALAAYSALVQRVRGWGWASGSSIVEVETQVSLFQKS